jgi:3-hydroxy-9,10-secoandrosta-1,3,5(10)-triene-9,17-dione monooxygenase reductase component
MSSSSVDGNQLRTVMRRFASPVTVVTCAARDEPRGITIGSFTSVSLDPPLVSFNVHQEANSHDLIMNVGRFAVHLLTDKQAHLANHFALPDLTPAQQFDPVDVEWRDGLPHLRDVLASFVCTLYASHPASDHSIFIGQVKEIQAQGMQQDPVLYFNRSYRSVGGEVKSMALTPVNAGSNASS